MTVPRSGGRIFRVRGPEALLAGEDGTMHPRGRRRRRSGPARQPGSGAPTQPGPAAAGGDAPGRLPPGRRPAARAAPHPVPAQGGSPGSPEPALCMLRTRGMLCAHHSMSSRGLRGLPFSRWRPGHAWSRHECWSHVPLCVCRGLVCRHQMWCDLRMVEDSIA